MGTPIQGAPIQSAPIQGAPVQGAYQPPTYIQPSYVSPGTPMAPIQGGVVQGAPAALPSPTGAYQPAVAFDTGIPCGTGAGAPASFAAPVYSAPSFESPAIAVAPTGPQRNRVFGARGLFFSRNNENNRELSFNNAGDKLNSNDASHGSFGGFETFLTSRGANGTGWEARYFGLYPSDATAEIAGAPSSTLRGLQDLQLGNPQGAGTDVFDAVYSADQHVLTRRTDIDSIGFNFLRNAGSTNGRHGRSRTHEMLLGFRWFQFDEDLRYESFINQAGLPQSIAYSLETQNTLLGFQFGSRSEACVSNRVRLVAGTKVGLFNNRSRVRQTIYDNNSNIANIGIGADAGTAFDFRDEDDSLAVLGEFDLGLVYQISCRSRFNFGYRAIGVSGVALAGDQVPNNFSSIPEVREIDNSGSLILQGGYAGLEMSY